MEERNTRDNKEDVKGKRVIDRKESVRGRGSENKREREIDREREESECMNEK